MDCWIRATTWVKTLLGENETQLPAEVTGKASAHGEGQKCQLCEQRVGNDLMNVKKAAFC